MLSISRTQELLRTEVLLARAKKLINEFLYFAEQHVSNHMVEMEDSPRHVFIPVSNVFAPLSVQEIVLLGHYCIKICFKYINQTFILKKSAGPFDFYGTVCFIVTSTLRYVALGQRVGRDTLLENNSFAKKSFLPSRGASSANFQICWQAQDGSPTLSQVGLGNPP